MRRRTSLLCLIALALGPLPADSDDLHTTVGRRYTALPLTSFSSDDGPGYGIRMASYTYDGKTVPYHHAFTIQAFFTTRGKWAHRALLDIPQVSSGTRLEIEVKYDKEENASFFGVLTDREIDTYSTRQQTFRQQDPYVNVRWIRDLHRPWRLQFGARVGKTFISTHVDSGAILDTLSPLGSAGGGLAQLNLALRYDTRDNYINPTAGSLTEAKLEHGIGSGGDYNGGAVSAQHRLFKMLLPRLVLAHRTWITYTFGDVPFYEQPKLGSSQTLRGLSANRFCDEGRILVNTELRWLGLQVSRRHKVYGGFTFFGDVGQVFSRSSAPDPDAWKMGLGVGGRIYWYSTVVRADYGRAENDSAIYMRFAHVF